jgi:hypothetical protein
MVQVPVLPVVLTLLRGPVPVLVRIRTTGTSREERGPVTLPVYPFQKGVLNSQPNCWDCVTFSTCNTNP